MTSGLQGKTPFRISGIFRSGNKALDDSVAYGLLSEIQLLTAQSGMITDIAVRLKDVNRSLAKAEEWRGLGDEKVLSWQEANSSFFAIFKLQDAIRYSMTAAILTVAGFGIYNILNVIINQKKREDRDSPFHWLQAERGFDDLFAPGFDIRNLRRFDRTSHRFFDLFKNRISSVYQSSFFGRSGNDGDFLRAHHLLTGVPPIHGRHFDRELDSRKIGGKTFSDRNHTRRIGCRCKSQIISESP